MVRVMVGSEPIPEILNMKRMGTMYTHSYTLLWTISISCQEPLTRELFNLFPNNILMIVPLYTTARNGNTHEGFFLSIDNPPTAMG